MGNQKTQKKANTVLIAGVLFNLSIGVLYAWSVLKTNMTASVLDGGWGWNSRQAGLPYTIAILCFASGVLIGGRIQDKAGPRWVVTAGGLMVGLGLVLSGLIGNNPGGIAVSFGVVSGLGIGIGYGCVTPAALKWFHPSRKGFVSGMVVGGFGLGAVYLAPLASALLRHFTIEQTKLVMGIAIMVISACVAQFIKNPPEGYVPIEPKGIVKSAKRSGVPADLTWREMMRTKRFYIMFFLYLFSASVGLMVLGNVTKIATLQAGITDAALLAGLVSFMAVMNFLGRIAGGMMSDKIGRTGAIFVVLGLQLINMSAFSFYSSLPAIIIGIIGAGFCFGALLSIFPALTADQFGLKNYGLNYGIIYLAWGLSGVVAPVIADYFFDLNGSFHIAYIICAVMMVFMLALNALLKKDIESLKQNLKTGGS
ncbi:MAG: OFA family MFS transporter [Oscillospiraceae bacterium]|nr:OFA family MFS transporter [Oscillospiraceae bacterium]